MLTGFIQFAVMKQRQTQAIMSRIVMGIDFKAAAECLFSARHIAPMIISNAQIVMSEQEARVGKDRTLVPLGGLIEQPFMKVQRAKKMAGKGVTGLGGKQTLQLAACFLTASLSFMNQGKQQALIDSSVAQE